MHTTKTLPVQLAALGLALSWLTYRAEATSSGPDRSTFQLQTRSRMSGLGQGAGPQGWASSRYSQRLGNTNQTLAISCQGLVPNQVYHVMGSAGTNGTLMHLADFMPSRSGAILVQYAAGMPHHFAGTNDPGPAWGMMGDWTNHMSWVLLPGSSSSNWCGLMDGLGGGMQPMSVMGGMGGGGGMGGTGSMGGTGDMADGWPAMANWGAGMTNWGAVMADWCWDYTNMWNPEAGYGGSSTNWWGNMGRGAYHMMPWPGSLAAVPALNGLVVMDGNLQPVLSADLASPDTFGYQTFCEFTNAGVMPEAMASLRANATQRTTHFMLSATGLAPRTSYFLAINGANPMPVTSDAHGRLRMRKLPSGLTSMRGIGTMTILDADGTPLLSATLTPD